MLKYQKKLEQLRNKHMEMLKNNKGFTLIELIIVIVIIGILVAIAMTDMSRNTEDAKIARAKEDLRTLAGAAQLYDVDTGKGKSNLDGKKITAGSADKALCDILQKTETKIDGNMGGPWIKTCPTPPWEGASYEAYVDTDDNKTDINFRVTSTNGVTLDSKDLSKVDNK